MTLAQQLAQAASSPLTGAQRYQPIAQIGRGGMAEVLLAMKEAGGGVRRLAVLKRIWPELANDPDFVTMFLDEARLSLRLNHANVVQTYEVLTTDGELAIAMEYLDGQPLTRVLNRLRGPRELGLPLRLRVLTSVLAGLEHAHTLTDLDGTPLEVVHRDVSPQNVFVTYDGQVKLVDFGVAQTLAASHHTRPGAIKGKLAYMAPEQFRRAEIDRRADVFAVGVMLWEMLAGRRMWHGMTEVEIVGALASGEPMPALPPDVNLPAGLDAICARALDPDPDRRYQTAADLEIDLEGVLIGSADSHARNLGKVVSMAFTAERAERQELIERALRRSTTRGTTPGSRVLADDDLEIEVSTDEAQGARTAARAPGPAMAPAVDPSLESKVWLRRAAMMVGLATVAAFFIILGGMPRPPSIDAPPLWVPPVATSVQHESAPTMLTSASFVPTLAPVQGTGLTLQPPTLGRPQSPSLVSGRSNPDDQPRRRKRHHSRQFDEDGTLPPNDGVVP
jgi:serine/threonine-protein kinase